MRCPPDNRSTLRRGWQRCEEAHKVRLTTRIVTGTTEQPECLVADVYAVVPLSKPKEVWGKESATCGAEDHRLLSEHTLNRKAGLEFALLTGDFNQYIGFVRMRKLLDSAV